MNLRLKSLHNEMQDIDSLVSDNLNKLRLDFKDWKPPNKWHSDEDPAEILEQFRAMFIALDNPITPFKLGIMYNKYQIAKKLWIYRPITYKVLKGLYTFSMCILMLYSILSIIKYESIYFSVRFILFILFIYDIISRIIVLFGCFDMEFIESMVIVPVIFGCFLLFFGDPIGILLYCMSFLIIIGEVIKRLYYLFLSNLLE